MVLVIDRTIADKNYISALNSKGWIGMTSEEKEYWLSFATKGAYEFTDWNRVESFVRQLADMLFDYGYAIAVNTKTDWTKSDLFRPSDADRYLTNIAVLRSVLAAFPTTPETPETMDNLTWQGANDIEKILVDVDQLIGNMAAAFRHSGTFNSGMEGLRI